MTAPLRVLVTGAGGFIGHHLAGWLQRRGCWVRGVDRKLPSFGDPQADEFALADLRDPDEALLACKDVDEVYALAADMGGMGFISANHATILHDNALIDANTVHGAWLAGVGRLLYASSACVYPEDLQATPQAAPLAEDDGRWRAPEDAYGFGKLLGERLCRAYRQQHGLETRVARFHNVYGPLGTFDGGREKAPAALCRKVALAPPGGTVQVWGDGRQTRSFLHVDDCVEGIWRIMRSDHPGPLNLGTDRAVSVDELARMVIGTSGKPLEIEHVPGPQGVRGRNADLTRMRRVLGWEPQTPLEDGIAETYAWIAAQVGR
jgi:nucleoside-diphosphate-sugar epimerase